MALQEILAIRNRVQDGPVSLTGKARHEKKIDAAATKIQGILDHRLEATIIVLTAEPVTDIFIVRLRGNLQVEMGNSLSDPCQLISRGRLEKLKSDVVSDLSPLQARQKSEPILCTRLEYVPNDHDRGIQMVDAVEDIICQKMGRPVCRSSPAGYFSEGPGRSSTGMTVVGTTPTREDGGDRITKPVEKGFIPTRVSITKDLLHDVPIIDRDVIKIARHIGQGVHTDLSRPLPPGEVGDRMEISPVPQNCQELTNRLFGRVPSHHKIDLRVAFKDLLMKIGGRDATKDDRDGGMKTLADLGQRQSTLNVSHPVQIKTEELWGQRSNQFLCIKPFILEHLESHIDDSNPKAMPLQILGQTHEPNRVELENRCRGHNIADRAMHDRTLPKIIQTGRMEKDQIKL
jgi:hypothetical protein